MHSENNIAVPAVEGLRASTLFDLNGFVAVVTGGASGIGLTAASTLMANGATVYIVDVDRDALQRVPSEWNKGGAKGKMIGLYCDTGDKASIVRLADELGRREPFINALFNNAAIRGPQTILDSRASAEDFGERLLELENKHFDEVMHVNTTGPLFLAASLLPLLSQSKRQARPCFVPSIIFTASLNSKTKDPSTGNNRWCYILSKSATLHLSQLLAHELLPLGIRVNSFAPGRVVTAGKGPEVKVDLLGRVASTAGLSLKGSQLQIPTKEEGASVEDIGKLVLMLVTNQFITGEVILMDGGSHLCVCLSSLALIVSQAEADRYYAASHSMVKRCSQHGEKALQHLAGRAVKVEREV